jgi:hypothetical protein
LIEREAAIERKRERERKREPIRFHPEQLLKDCGEPVPKESAVQLIRIDSFLKTRVRRRSGTAGATNGTRTVRVLTWSKPPASYAARF